MIFAAHYPRGNSIYHIFVTRKPHLMSKWSRLCYQCCCTKLADRGVFSIVTVETNQAKLAKFVSNGK